MVAKKPVAPSCVHRCRHVACRCVSAGQKALILAMQPSSATSRSWFLRGLRGDTIVSLPLLNVIGHSSLCGCKRKILDMSTAATKGRETMMSWSAALTVRHLHTCTSVLRSQPEVAAHVRDGSGDVLDRRCSGTSVTCSSCPHSYHAPAIKIRTISGFFGINEQIRIRFSSLRNFFFERFDFWCVQS